MSQVSTARVPATSRQQHFLLPPTPPTGFEIVLKFSLFTKNLWLILGNSVEKNLSCQNLYIDTNTAK